MSTETNEQPGREAGEALPFPYTQRPFCPYEPIEKRIGSIRVLVVNNLILREENLSDLARREWGARAASRLERERSISPLAMDNIVGNVTRLVREPETRVVHLSRAPEEVESFRPHAVVVSGTLFDFDYYRPEMLEDFGRWVRATKIPVLGICGGHQLVGESFGARCVTLDDLAPAERREGREYEYQYRFVRITEPADPIFTGVNEDSGVWQDYTTEGNVLRVWQNHGLQLDRVPDDFKLLATSYRCRNQMMVRRRDGQLIYTVQFHLEKSFQDLTNTLERADPNQALKPSQKKRMLRHEASMRTLWAHPHESRDGRLLFENFLRLSLEHHGLEP